MLKNSKLFLGVLTSITLVFSFTTTCFANENKVSKTQDNIKITKTANWTMYNGKSTDSNGNPYAKINFEIDATAVSTEVVTSTSVQNSSADIVLILDNSNSMTGQKIYQLKEAVRDFCSKMLTSTNSQIKIGIIGFDTEAYLRCALTSDLNELNRSLSKCTTKGGTYARPAISMAIDMIRQSNASNKFFIFLSDGEVGQPNETKLDFINATNTISNLKVLTVGYATPSFAAQLKDMASKDTSNNPMYHDATIDTTNIVNSIKNVFCRITHQVVSYIKVNTLTDTIPKEFSIVDGTITCDDSKLTSSISSDKHSITWNWGVNKLEKKLYKMSVITVLNKSQTPSNLTKINTNGTTIIPSVDSSQSAIFTYSKTKKILLSSPKLTLNNNNNIDGSNTLTIDTSNSSPSTNFNNTNSLSTSDSNNNSKQNSNDTTPATGDTTITFISIGFILFAITAVVTYLMLKKRKHYI